jgi:hypothetical protein
MPRVTIKLSPRIIAHFSRPLATPPDNKRQQFCAIAEEIKAIDPDIPCIVDGPGSLPDLRDGSPSDQGLAGNCRLAAEAYDIRGCIGRCR